MNQLYFSWRFVVVVLIPLTLAVPEEITELKIETSFTPDDCGVKSKKGDRLSLHYIGTLHASGKKFDSSVEHEPFSFVLGSGQVIDGWEQGLLDMCVGEKRTLLVPPSLGYGAENMDDIPSNSVLKFEVELLDIEQGDEVSQDGSDVFKEIDSNTDNALSQDEVSSYVKKAMVDAEEVSPDDEKEHDKMISEIFEHEDKDRDGYISFEEFSGPKHEEL